MCMLPAVWRLASAGGWGPQDVWLAAATSCLQGCAVPTINLLLLLLLLAACCCCPPPQGLSGHLVEVIALLLLPVAIAMCGYAIFIFIWRSQMIAKKRVRHTHETDTPTD